jgi:hypothetical protein
MQFEVYDLGLPLGRTRQAAVSATDVQDGRSGLCSPWLGRRRFRLGRRGDFVYACLVDLARRGDLRVVDSAELVVAVRESPEAVAAAMVTFDVAVGAGNERHDRGQGEEFDQAGRPDDRLAKEGCQHCG